MRFCALWLAIAASGCASIEPPVKPTVVTDVRVEQVEVPKLVRMPCVAAQDVPALPKPTPVDVKTADTRQLAAVTAADLLALELYAQRADAILRACASAPPPK